MDTVLPEKKETPEQTRESLIAISQYIPDRVPASTRSSDDLNSVNLVDMKDGDVIHGDEAEKFRSELISISYTQSPDTKALPVALGNHSN